LLLSPRSMPRNAASSQDFQGALHFEADKIAFDVIDDSSAGRLQGDGGRSACETPTDGFVQVKRTASDKIPSPKDQRRPAFCRPSTRHRRDLAMRGIETFFGDDLPGRPTRGLATVSRQCRSI
jgi:hypothetical protein